MSTFLNSKGVSASMFVKRAIIIMVMLLGLISAQQAPNGPKQPSLTKTKSSKETNPKTPSPTKTESEPEAPRPTKTKSPKEPKSSTTSSPSQVPSLTPTKPPVPKVTWRKYLKQNGQRCDPNADGEDANISNPTKSKCLDACDEKEGCIAYQYYEEGQERECKLYTKTFRFTTINEYYMCAILKRIRPKFQKKRNSLCNEKYANMEDFLTVKKLAKCNQACRRNWLCRAYQYGAVFEEPEGTKVKKCLLLLNEEPESLGGVKRRSCYVKLDPVNKNENKNNGE